MITRAMSRAQSYARRVHRTWWIAVLGLTALPGGYEPGDQPDRAALTVAPKLLGMACSAAVISIAAVIAIDFVFHYYW